MRWEAHTEEGSTIKSRSSCESFLVLLLCWEVPQAPSPVRNFRNGSQHASLLVRISQFVMLADLAATQKLSVVRSRPAFPQRARAASVKMSDPKTGFRDRYYSGVSQQTAEPRHCAAWKICPECEVAINVRFSASASRYKGYSCQHATAREGTVTLTVQAQTDTHSDGECT